MTKLINNVDFAPMVTLEPFTDGDWDAFAGATEFDDGRQPLCGEIKLNGGAIEALLIVDNTGIEINVNIEKDLEDEQMIFTYDTESEARMIRVLQAMKALARDTKGIWLEDLTEVFGYRQY